MALFSRRPKDRRAKDEPTPEPEATSQPEEITEDPTPPDVPATMNISVSSYQGLGSQPVTPPPTPEPDQPSTLAPRRGGDARAETAPQTVETIGGLRDNVVLREALAAVSKPAAAEEILDVARQLMQGHLFLRVKGDARALLAEGKPLPLGVASMNDKQYVLAYSSGAALRASVVADNDSDTSAMGQPVASVIRHVLAGPYAGLILDNSSAPARAILPRDLLQKMLDQADETLELKSLLAGERTDGSASAVAEALTRVKLWVAVNRSAEGRLGVAEARTTDGGRLIEVYSHPLEVSTMRRGDQPAPMTAVQLAAALRADEGIGGIIVDPAGPWIRLSREDLAPLLALPV
jgi:SseB protein N-terminal domain